ncbi:MAG: hypothetical protein ABI783_03285, partial [Actinomycetota bacterium]
MARKRATMREGPLAELFRKTEAAQRAQDAPSESEPEELTDDRRAQVALEATVEHVHDFVGDAVDEPLVSTPAQEEIPSEAAASRAAARYFQTMLEPAPRLHRV